MHINIDIDNVYTDIVVVQMEHMDSEDRKEKGRVGGWHSNSAQLSALKHMWYMPIQLLGHPCSIFFEKNETYLFGNLEI